MAEEKTSSGKGFGQFRNLSYLLAFPFLLSSCSKANMPMLNPVGQVAESEYELLVISTLIMACIIVPVIIATLWIAWRYRASNDKAKYDPEFEDSKPINMVTLFVPMLTILALGTVTWIYTHRLDPYRPLGGDERPYEIQAVSLDYKWLFIYPEEGVATVNQLVAPTGRPVTIRITSDPMMTSIFIPAIISQIYAMPGMETRANFLAPEPTVLEGANAMYSGPGFSKQRFLMHLLTPDEFQAWADNVGSANNVIGDAEVTQESRLNFERYEQLVERTEGYPITYFSSTEPELFSRIVQKYMPHYSMKPLKTTEEYDKEL
ncbi:ubiquinol oxidase subunit II [Kangiella sp. TOML190]|uniref:ubiquinol oxidase subunit II n=1 Tax=Kangiella sp. TOML190 TaxID=2931351 RepID=UPI00203C7041|nr:ubiquinol oxidase subunit II [Kangiella sp. TOML190]